MPRERPEPKLSVSLSLSFPGGLPQCNPRTSPPAPRAGVQGIARPRSSAGWRSSSPRSCSAGMIGGQKTIADEDYGNGSSKVADKAIANANFRDSADEQVLVQGKGSVKVGDAAFTAAVKDTVSRLEAHEGRRQGQVPARQGQRGPALQGRPLRARDVRDPRRRRRDRRTASTPRSPPPRPRRRPIPRSASSSSATPARTRRSRRPSRTTSRRPSSSRSRSRC